MVIHRPILAYPVIWFDGVFSPLPLQQEVFSVLFQMALKYQPHFIIFCEFLKR